jgi:flavin-binding protein dodecin
VAFLVWKYIEVVGESPESFVDAVKGAVSEAAKTVRGMDWFEVASLRGRIMKNKVESSQAVVKIGILHMQSAARHGDVATVKLCLGRKTEKTMRYDSEIKRKPDYELVCGGYLKAIGLDPGMWNVTTLPVT